MFRKSYFPVGFVALIFIVSFLVPFEMVYICVQIDKSLRFGILKLMRVIGHLSHVGI